MYWHVMNLGLFALSLGRWLLTDEHFFADLVNTLVCYKKFRAILFGKRATSKRKQPPAAAVVVQS